MGNMKTTGYCIAINNQDGRVPDWVHIIPAGQFYGRDGRGPWRVSDPAAFIKATHDYQGGADISLDYEHQSEMTEKNGQPAPAAGWIKELEALKDGIWARVDWTIKAAEMVAAREYRYLSPVFIYDRGGELVRLESVALTNKPNLELKALNKQGVSMDNFLIQLATLLGLAETATQEEIFAAVQQLKESGSSSNSDNADDQKKAENDDEAGDTPPDNLPEAEAKLLDAVSDLINVAEDEAGAASAPQKKAANKAQAVFKYMHSMGNRLAGLEQAVASNKAEKAVGEALKAGKITPGLKPWALNYAINDPDGFAKFVASAPVVVQPGRAAGGVMGGSGSLGQEAKAVCKQLGISEADYLKSAGGK